jgi:hypothetical protein
MVESKTETAKQADWEMLAFKVPPAFKKAVERFVFERDTTIRQLATKGLAREIGVPVPKEAA